MTRSVLDEEEVLWAYQKCCDGVPVAVVARALYCAHVTLTRSFKRYGLRVTNTLKFKRGGSVNEYEKKVVEDLRRNARRSGAWDPGKEDMQVAADLIEELCGQRDALRETCDQALKALCDRVKKERENDG